MILFPKIMSRVEENAVYPTTMATDTKQTFFHPVILFGAEILSGKSRCRQTNTLHRQNIKTVDFIVCRTSGHRIRTKTVNAALYNDI